MASSTNSNAGLLPQLQRWQDDWHSQQGQERQLSVRWLLNPEEQIVENVCLTEQSGQLVDIRPCKSGSNTVTLPVVLVPPFVNAHTHLEFSNLAEPVQPAQPFQSWIQSLMKWRGSNASNQSESIRLGIKESINSCVALIGEIATNDDIALLSSDRASCVAFRELIGLGTARIQQQIELAEHFLSAPEVPGVRRALSPHAPYTVHPELLEQAVAMAANYNVPVAMHLAETTDELELLQSGTGRFRTFLSSMGLFDPQVFPGGRHILDVLTALSAAPSVLAVHGNYFCDEDILFLSRHPNFTTVYCPRTHFFFGHTPHPFRKLIEAGCRVILGTDSRASNPDLSIWRELQHVVTLAPEISPGQLLSMITTHAAAAMHFDSARFRIQVQNHFSPVFLIPGSSAEDFPAMLQNPQTIPWRPTFDQTSNTLPFNS